MNTDHFTIYSKQNKQTIIHFAEKIERFHSLMDYVFQRKNFIPSDQNKLTIFILQNRNQVRKLHGGKNNRYIAGFYIPNSGNSSVFITTLRKKSKTQSLSEQILLHEYTHHYLMGSSSSYYPMWLNEGSAEFFSNVIFEKNGSIGLGMPAHNRKVELSSPGIKKIKTSTLLDTKKYLKEKNSTPDNFYGRSWLLFHKLIFSKERLGQLDHYLKLLKNNYSEIDSANLAFGNLDILDKELNEYQKQKSMVYAPIPKSFLSEGNKIELRILSKVEQETINMVMQLKRGITDEKLREFLPKINDLVKKNSENINLLSLALDINYKSIARKIDSSDLEWTLSLSDKILKIQSDNSTALRYKALILSKYLLMNEQSIYNWNQVHKLLEKAIRLDPKNPLALENYFDIFQMQKVNPTELATKRLQLSVSLSPFDKNLRGKLAHHYFKNELYKRTVDTLKPLLSDTHNKEIREWAIKLTEQSLEKLSLQESMDSS